MGARDELNLAPLPWNDVAEQSLLGALLLDSDAHLRVAERRLLAGHFFDQRHRLIYGAISALTARRLPVDVVTVFEHLQAAGQHDHAGGLEYLNALSQGVASAAHIAHYADIVLDSAARRAICEAGDQARELARSQRQVAEVLDEFESSLAAIRDQRIAKPAQRIGDLLFARTAHWEALEAGAVQAGTPTRLHALDDVLGGGIKPGRNMVLAARPSVGKSSLAAQIALSVAQQGKPVLMLSMEMSADELADRAAASLGRVRLDRLARGNFDGEDWGRIGEACDAARQLPLFIHDAPALTLLDIRAKAREVQRDAGGLALVVVDYLQLASSAGNHNTRHHAIEAISRGLKSLAMELGTTVLTLSQLNREADGAEPEMHHLKESGAIEEDADVVLLLHPVGDAPEGGMLVLAKAAKNRQGRRGRFALAFDGALQRWSASVGDVSRRGAMR